MGVKAGDNRGAGLRFLLQFDPGKAWIRPHPARRLALRAAQPPSRLEKRTVAVAGGECPWRSRGRKSEEGDDSGGSANSIVSTTTTISLCLAAMYASDQRPRRAPPLPQQWRCLPAPDSDARFECFVRILIRCGLPPLPPHPSL
jgi:hypothetical protein